MPLVVTVHASQLQVVPSLRKATGPGCLFIGYGALSFADPARGLPRERQLEKLQLDDFVDRQLTGEAVGKLVWNHVSAVIRTASKPEDQPAEGEEQAWTRILTSEASSSRPASRAPRSRRC